MMETCGQDVQVYVRAIGQLPLLSPRDEEELAERAGRGDRKARSRLILGGLRLVATVARKHRLSEPCLFRVIATGHRALEEAVDRFDPTDGVRFRSFAMPFIRRAVQQMLDATGTAALPPRHSVRGIRASLSRAGAKKTAVRGRQRTGLVAVFESEDPKRTASNADPEGEPR